MSQTKNRNSKLVDADAHKKALQHVINQRAHWSVPKITAFCKTCKNLPELIDFNIKIEDAYQNFWKNDMRTVVRFAKRFIELLKWITTDEHRQVIVLNFAYYDFALIQKIYTRFYHIESIVKRMQIAMSVIEIFQITPTLSSLNDAQLTHLNKIQQGIYRTWMAFWSDDTSIKFFNISSVNLSSLNATHSIDNNENNIHSIDDIDDLLIEQKDDPAIDHSIEDFDENNSIFTIDENEDLCDEVDKKIKENDRDSDDDQPLRVDSYLPISDRIISGGIPIIRTINIADELSDINKQLVFISDIIAWLKQQILRIKSKLYNVHKLTNNDHHTFNAIIVCLRKLLLDSSAISSLCVSTPVNENNKNKNKNIKIDTSSYLRMIIDIVRDLTDECCKSNKIECIKLFKSILIDIVDNKLTHHLVKQLLQIFVDRISNHQYNIDYSDNNKNKNDDDNDNNDIINDKKYLSEKYIFHIRILNCQYYVDYKQYGNNINKAYSDYLKQMINIIIDILNKRRFNILYVLSSYNNETKNENKEEEKQDETDTFNRLMICVDVTEVINNSELELNTVVSIVSDEIIQTICDGFYRLNIRFYPIYSGCKHIYSTDSDFFYHRGLSLRDEINKIIVKKKKYNNLMKSILCLALTKQPTDIIIFKRFRLLKKLKDILIKVHGSDARYEIFGSMATKLDHIESDLDISIHLPSNNILSFDNYFANNNLNISDLTMEVKQHRIQKILKPIYKEIIKIPKERGPNGYDFKVIFLEHATVPIVKLIDENNGLQSDISVCLTQSVIKTKLIKKYVSIDWRVKPLVLSIKHWVKTRKLNNTHRGDLNSFGFTLMIIHYLQNLNPPILPILQIENQVNQNKKYIPNWAKSHKYVCFGQKNKKNIGQLFTGFFIYFHQKFNPDIHAISITNNINKNKINGFLNKNVCELQNNHNNILIVLDPLDNTDNIGRRVTQVTWNNMKKEYQLAAQITTSNNNNNANNNNNNNTNVGI